MSSSNPKSTRLFKQSLLVVSIVSLSVTACTTMPNNVTNGVSTKTTYPNTGYVNPNTGYVNPNTGYANPNTGYANPNTGYVNPNTGYVNPNTGYVNPNTGYVNPNAGYVNPNAGYENSLLNQTSVAELAPLLKSTKMQMVSNEQNLINKHGNIWDIVRRGYKLQPPQSPVFFNSTSRVQKQWFISQKRYLFDSTSRASRYLFYTVNEAILRGVPTEIALLPLIDSSYDPFAVDTERGNAGIWQLDENTANKYGYQTSQEFDPRKDIVLSTRIAYNELTNYKNQFGSWEHAIAAKHSGSNVVYQAIQKNAAKGLSRDFWALDLPLSTKNYVARFWAMVDIINNPQANKVFLPAVANRPYFTAIRAENGLTLSKASQMVGVSVSELKFLNPGLRQNSINNTAPNRLFVPGSNYEIANKNGIAKQAQPNIIVKPTSTRPNNIYNNAYSSDAALNRYPAMNNQQISSNTTRHPLKAFAPNENVIQEPYLNSTEVQHISGYAKTSSNINISPNRPTYQQGLERLAIPASGYYKVQSGNTLIGTAYKFGLTPTQLALYNKIKVTQPLYVGQKLFLVETNKQSNIQTSRAAPTTSPVTRQNVVKNPTTYKVKNGDTLLGVANRLNIPASQLAAINGLTTQSNLRRGSTLKIPTENVLLRSSVTKNNASQRDSLDNNILTYTVRQSDSLAKLAKLTNSSVPEVAKLNNLSVNSRLFVGDTIYLPNKIRNYIVQSNETLTSIAKNHHTTVGNLAKINGFAPSYRLQRGQNIKVPH